MDNFMKFKKGTLDAFKKLVSKDPDTIYLIKDLTTGKVTMYLGDSPVVDEFNLKGLNLFDLNDLEKTDKIKDGDILTYDGFSKTWKPQPPIIDTIISQINNEDELNKLQELIEDINKQYADLEKNHNIQKENVKTLFSNVARLNQSMSNLTAAATQKSKGLDEKMIRVEELVNNLKNFNKQYITMKELQEELNKYNDTLLDIISNQLIEEKVKVDHLERKIFNDLEEAKIFIKANEEEAVRYIYMIPTGLEHDDNKYYEYLCLGFSDFEEPLMSKVGSWSINLSDYVLKNEFNDRLTKVEKLLETFVKENEYKEQLNKIEKALSGVAWADLGEGE